MWAYNRNTDTYSNVAYNSVSAVPDSRPGPQRKEEFLQRLAAGERPKLVQDGTTDDPFVSVTTKLGDILYRNWSFL